jgi:hypothetical protein
VIPYGGGKPPLAASSSVLALMAGVVLAPLRRLLMAALCRPVLLAPGRLRAGARAVAVTAVAAAADGEGATALPAVAQMKDRNLERGHRSRLQR